MRKKNDTKIRPHYSEILEHLKTYFPSPMPDPIMDGYLVNSISHFLDQINNFKSASLASKNDYKDCEKSRFPKQISSIEETAKTIASYCQGIPNWSHPNVQINVHPPLTISGITACIATAICNPNIVTDEYSGNFVEAEIRSIAMLSDLIGYDAEKSGGLFTFGGTGTVLYGCKLGIEKAMRGQGMEKGVGKDIKIFSSNVAHYSRLNVAAWLGIGTENAIAIKSISNNEISLSALEEALRITLNKGEKIGAIIATLGTTDAFGLDDLAAIVHLRDQLVSEYKLNYKPHIHADAVIGWAWTVFRDYDFEDNPLGFHMRTLLSLKDSLKYINNLQMADSVGIDFHKTGYAPYISSLLLLKDRNDFSLITRHIEQMPYLYQFGHYHPGIYSLECSRTGAGALMALANMELLGKQGYQVLIGHAVEMVEMLREQLEQYDYIKVLNDHNYGPVTLFRVYPPDINANEAFYREQFDPSYSEQLVAHNNFNRKIFDLIYANALQGSQGKEVLLSWTMDYHHPSYSNTLTVGAIKSVILSPWTNLKTIALVAEQINSARTKII